MSSIDLIKSLWNSKRSKQRTSMVNILLCTGTSIERIGEAEPDSTAVWTVAPMIIHVKRVTMHSYPG